MPKMRLPEKNPFTGGKVQVPSVADLAPMGMVFRGAGDAAKVVPALRELPGKLQTGAKIGGAFEDYLKRIAELLLQSPKR